MDLTHAHWRKSSRSAAHGECVELATNLPGVAAIRDSKNPNGGALVVRPSTLASFIDAVKSDRFEN